MTSIRKRLAHLDRGYLVVLVICLTAVWPFVSRAGLPAETDAELHIFRLAELARLVAAGELYPRWAPHFYYGFGYPIFNYYAPLTYYLGLPLTLLPGLDAVAGVKFVFVLGIMAGGLGVYGFVRDNWGQAGAYVATAVYVYAPYIQYVDPHARGALAESFSFGVFPLALWALDRLRRRPTGWRFATAVLLVAAVFLAHNLMAMVFGGLLGAWVLWSVISNKYSVISEQSTSARPHPRPFSRRERGGSASYQSPTTDYLLLTTVLLGFAVAAFFWLPLGLERDAVNLGTLLGQGDNFDFRTHFLSLATLLRPSPWLDWGASEPAFAFNVGLMQWLLGGAGLAALLARRTQRGWFFGFALAALLFLMLPASTAVWEAIPLLPFLQFPWRLLGAAVAMLAILSGIGVAAWLGRSDRREWIAAGLTALTIGLGLPLSDLPPWPPDFGPQNTRQVMEIELQGRWLGTTSTADFVPATVDVLPHPADSLLDALRQGRPLDPVNRASLPDAATVQTENISSLHYRFTVSSPKPFPLRLFIFDFPGWTARVDGQPVETELGRPEGFIVVPLPAGEHQVDVAFGGTPARRVGWATTTVALLLTLVIAARLERGETGETVESKKRGWTRLDGRVLLAAGLVTAVYLFILQPLGLLHLHSTGDRAIPAQVDTYANFGDQIALIGYDVSETAAAPGDEVELTLYWRAQQPLDINYQIFVHLLRPDGTVAAQSDKLNPGQFPTERWRPDRYVRDSHQLALPPDLPPGDYVVTAGLWVQDEGWRLPVFDDDGRQRADRAALFRLTVADG